MWFPWIEFLVLSTVIAVAGYWLSRFGDVIGERTGMSGGWIGLVLMATVTSLPELVTGLGAIRIERSPDLAASGVLGSCVFNLLLLAVVDLAYRPAPLFTRISAGHALSVGYAAVLLALVGLNILAPVPLGGLSLSWASLLIAPIYLLALRTIFTYERRELMAPPESTTRRTGLSLRKAVLGYVGLAGVVTAAGAALPGVALRLAVEMGWSTTFVGAMFLAAATSLPELAVTLSALRFGAVDMAVANLLGSNLFNLAILAIYDLAYPEAPLLSEVASVNLVTVQIALLMNGVVTAGLIYRSKARPGGAMSWVGVALLGAYGVNAGLLLSGGR